MALSQPQPQPQSQHQDKDPESTSPKVTTATEPIPPLQIAPAIFVPITTDLTKPLPSYPTRVDRINAVLSAYDNHTAGVQSNLLSFLAREKARFCEVGAEAEAVQIAAGNPPCETRPGLQDELRMMVNFMRAPHNPNENYDKKNEIPALNLGAFEPRSQREFTARELMAFSHQAIVELSGHEKHVKDNRRRYEVALQKAKDEEAE